MDPADIPLRDIHLPAAISWWPLAPGWWVLLALLLVALGVGIGWFVWRRKYRVRHLAQTEFSVIAASFRGSGDRRALARDLSRLIRRAVIELEHNAGAASRSGGSWVAQLDRYSDAPPLNAETRAILATAPYEPDPSFDGETLLQGLRPWFEQLHAASAAPRD